MSQGQGTKGRYEDQVSCTLANASGKRRRLCLIDTFEELVSGPHPNPLAIHQMMVIVP